MTDQLKSDPNNSPDTRWHVWRSYKGESYQSIAQFQGATAEEAIERAVEHEIHRLPISGCSGMYFACPADMLTRRDWHVSYAKRDISNV